MDPKANKMKYQEILETLQEAIASIEGYDDGGDEDGIWDGTQILKGLFSDMEKDKYYKLCCNHVRNNQPFKKTFPINDDYEFMEMIEKRHGVSIADAGNYRLKVAQKGSS